MIVQPLSSLSFGGEHLTCPLFCLRYSLQIEVDLLENLPKWEASWNINCNIPIIKTWKYTNSVSCPRDGQQMCQTKAVFTSAFRDSRGVFVEFPKEQYSMHSFFCCQNDKIFKGPLTDPHYMSLGSVNYFVVWRISHSIMAFVINESHASIKRAYSALLIIQESYNGFIYFGLCIGWMIQSWTHYQSSPSDLSPSHWLPHPLIATP